MANLSESEMAIEIRGVTKRFGEKVALDGLSFSVKKGEVVGILGPNGAGKTTAINVLATLTQPDEGTVLVAGHDAGTSPHAVRQSIALTGQFAAVDDMLTGEENLILFGRLRGLGKSKAKERAGELLSAFSLAADGAKRAGTYSGGMRRRLDLAVSLVVPSEVVFLDEPTTGLDPRSRNELWDVVRGLRDDGMTIVLTTQYLEEADQLAERIIVIDEGEVIAEGTPDQLKETAGGRSIVAIPADPSYSIQLAEALQVFGQTEQDLESGAVTVLRCADTNLAKVALAAEHAGIELADLGVRVPTLDDVFLQLTGQEQPHGSPSSSGGETMSGSEPESDCDSEWTVCDEFEEDDPVHDEGAECQPKGRD